ncbi:MAG: FtsX-like permease family protein, partial [Bryobacteraceae bacterium]|nr:FtsX-like permease family protein [Bryobacteraceae bacterium]
QRKVDSAGSAALVVSVFGSVAHLLACLGILGAVAYSVSQRTKEIGIRMALGAHPLQILSLVLQQLSRPVGVGLVAGVLAAAALTQLLRQELYGLSNLDPVTYLAIITIFIVTAVLAALVPARAALRVDPLRALRHD